MALGAEMTATEMFRPELIEVVRLAALRGPSSMSWAALSRLPVITSSRVATIPWDMGSTVPRVLCATPSDEASAVLSIAGGPALAVGSVETSSLSMTKLLESSRREA